MSLRRIARLYLPPTFALSVMTVPRTPELGTGAHVLASWTEPASEPAGLGADPDAGADAGADAGEEDTDGGLVEPGGADCGGTQRLATTSTLGAGCC